MFTTFIRPQLKYASEVWDGCTQSDIEQLERKCNYMQPELLQGYPYFLLENHCIMKQDGNHFPVGQSKKLTI